MTHTTLALVRPVVVVAVVMVALVDVVNVVLIVIECVVDGVVVTQVPHIAGHINVACLPTKLLRAQSVTV